MKKQIFYIVLFLATQVNADMFDDMRNDAKTQGKKVDPMQQYREKYFYALQNREAPDIDTIKNFVIPEHFSNEASIFVNQPYFKDVLPYFFAGQKGELMQWDERTIKITQEQRRWCEDEFTRAQIARKEYDVAVQMAPLNQYGQRVQPIAAESRFKSNRVKQAIVCTEVAPVGNLSGWKAWESLQAYLASKNKLKGDF